MENTSALVFGEALVDVIRSQQGTTAAAGGSCLNVAVGLGRLGRAVRLATHLADDEYGRMCRAHLEASHVQLTPASDTASRTTTAIATLDATGAATYDFDLIWAPAKPELLPTDIVVHTGSLGALIAPGSRTVLDTLAAARAQATICFDPNARPSVMPPPAHSRELVEEYLAISDVVKASDEDLEWIYQTSDPAAVAEEIISRPLGPALFFMTRGAKGAIGWSRSGQVFELPGRPVDVVDTVGAGDSFMGGIIDQLWREDLLGAARREALFAAGGEVLERVLGRCMEIAAITVSRAGANPPWAVELPA